MTPISDRVDGRVVLAPWRWLGGIACSVLVLYVGMLVSPASAIQPIVPEQHAASSRLQQPIIAQDIEVQPALDITTGFAAATARYPQLADFRSRYGGEWEIRWDRRNDLPHLIQGSGVALVPGRGNSLTLARLGLQPDHQVDLATVETRLRDFIAANSNLLGVKGMDLRLDPGRSIAYGKGNTHWFVEFEQFHEGVRVEGANVYFRIAAGNIVQFGSNRIAPVRIGTHPVSGRDAALALALADIPFMPGTRVSELVEPGELLLLPVAPEGDSGAADFSGSSGHGYSHRLVWRFVLRVHDDEATYQVLLDAHTNRVIDVQNINAYVDATITGGIYPTTNTDPEVVVPMPYLAVTNGGAKVTDALGIYDYSGGTATTTLNGQYFRMSDGCGSISLSNSSDGNLALGTSGGTDCVTPGVGGAGNTHSSRSGFYHLTNINRKAITFLPGNSWLNSKVTANMNINDVCNAYWNGSSLNFFKSGTYGSTFCSNTGEIAAVFLHEWGHGMDTNSGGSASDMGSGEAVGDTFAFLETKDSCIGANFTPGNICHNCTTCTGVRDVKDFGLGGTRPIAKPSNVIAAGGIKCDDYVGLGGTSCPYTTNSGQVYRGPMGYEGHCESIIASSANWDLTQMLVDRWGASQGWQEMDRIWYGSLTPSKSAYRVSAGGTCNPNATVDGCGSSNWYTVFLAADDDNGNITDGTPNACRIWDAFNAHGIACGARPVCSNDAPDFTLDIAPATRSVCAMPSASAPYTVDVGQQMGFSNPVTLSASGLPSGVSAAFSPTTVTPGNSSTMTVNVNGAAAGTLTLTVNGSASGSAGHSVTSELVIATAQPGAPAPAAPADGATGTPRSPTFSWASDPAAEGYTIEVASDSAFTTIVASGSPATNSWMPSTPLAPLTTYYWRVRANSVCGNSAYSATFSFTTGVTFPEPYCPVTFPNNVEPITKVIFTGINNASSAVLNGSPALEDFLGVAGGLVQAGQSYPIAVEGNTDGAWTNVVNAFIDWNRDGSFGSGEAYPIGNITNSTGLDGKQATNTIAVPAGVTPGPVRMRVLKRYSSAATACNSTGYGQGEDYTLIVQGSASYTVGGSVTGLAGSGLVLSLNGSQSLPVSANGSFTFPTALGDGSSYAVTVATQPGSPAQTCTVSNGSGTLAGANVTNVAVACTTNSYTVGGSVTGLVGSGLVLSLNGGAQSLPVSANGSFTFPTALPDGSSYAVTVATQPTAPDEVCTVGNGSGTLAGADVTNVTVSCIDRIFADGFDDD
ncbi:MAG: hypothetical protein IT477_00155 [Rhodanobacteraceae bacterium]|nr:hypothetical protein [Rhodanobacteraceae bacterium]